MAFNCLTSLQRKTHNGTMVRNVPHSRQNCCLSHRKQTILRCSVENWPELGMEWLLVTFVTSLSVKWRLMTSFYRMSNKLFIQTRKTKNSGIKETKLFRVQMWHISILFICPLNKAIVDKVLPHKKWCWSDSIAQFYFYSNRILLQIL